jgi:hypothetical protein
MSDVSTENQTPDHQDVAMQFLMHGCEGLQKLYTENAIHPDVSFQAWNELAEHGRTTEDLASFLINVHMPLREARIPGLLPSREIMPEA